MKKLELTSIALATLILLTGSAHAGGLFGDIARGVGNAVGGSAGRAIAGAANAGDDASRNLQHGNVGGAVQNFGQMVVSTGQIQGGAISDVGRMTGNRDIQRFANAAASVVTINSDALGTATIVSGNVLAGQDLRQVYAAPLATAIRQARNAHIRESHHIPQAIQEALSGTIPASILQNARYAEGGLEISVANLINRTNRSLGDDYAVTVDDVIVFTDTPSDNPDDADALHWWAHELTHVWQYRRWGVDGFALQYINNYSFVENDADNIADVAVQRYENQ